MIKIKNLTKTFGVQNSLDNISLELNKGDSVIIMGQNGAGKTTLIRSIFRSIYSQQWNNRSSWK